MVSLVINKWIENFLQHRLKREVCNGEHSKWAPVLSGVSQNSVIGPIFFIVDINDLPDEVKATVRLFADDTIMYATITSALKPHASVPFGIFESAMVRCIIFHALAPDALQF